MFIMGIFGAPLIVSHCTWLGASVDHSVKYYVISMELMATDLSGFELENFGTH